MNYDEAVCQRHCFQKMNVFVGTLDLSESAYHYYLDMACKIQVDILSCTDKPKTITDSAMQALHDWGSPKAGPHGAHQWPALLRMLDTTHSDYKA